MKHAREGGPVRYRARVEYDGTEFAGFQAQPGRRTVQGELERALAHLFGGRRIPISAAGRTDAGVHATGQVIAFTWHGAMPANQLGPAIGALLPPDVAIGPLRRVEPGFDPRRAAIRREYRYSIWNGPRSPLRERFVYTLEDRLDVEAMQQAADELVGRHVMAVVNFPPRQIGPVMSEVLPLGVPDADGEVVLLTPDKDVPIGGRLY